MGDSEARRAAESRPLSAPDARTVLDGVSDLREEDVSIAPHVLARVHARVGTSRDVVRSVVQTLTESQRHGLRALPVPLPVSATVLGLEEDIALSDAERTAFVVVALGTTDRVDVLLAITGLSVFAPGW